MSTLNKYEVITSHPPCQSLFYARETDPCGAILREQHCASEEEAKRLLVRWGNSTAPTPLPWKWQPELGNFIVGPRGETIAEIPCQGCNQHDGEFIVRACNNHEALLEIAEAAHALMTLAAKYCTDNSGIVRDKEKKEIASYRGLKTTLMTVAANALDAIKKAKEGTP